MRALIVGSITVLFLLSGCSMFAPKPNVYPEDGPAPTLSQLEAFANEIDDALTSSNTIEFNALFDRRYILASQLEGIEFRQGQKANYIEAVLRSSGNIGQEIINVYDDEFHCDLVKYHIEGNIGKLIFRTDGHEAFNYYDFDVAVNLKGELRIIDAFYHWTCIKESTIMHKQIMLDLASGHLAFADNPQIDQKYLDGVLLGEEISANIIDGRYQEADLLFSDLPAEIFEQASTQLEWLLCTQYNRSEEYDDALTAFVETDFDGLNTHYRAYDLLQMNWYSEEALRQVELLDSILGTDPYLNVLRCSMSVDMDDDIAALALADSVSKDFPNRSIGLFCHARIANKVASFDQNYTTVVNYFDTLARHFNVPLSYLEEISRNNLFCDSSPEYLAWVDTVNLRYNRSYGAEFAFLDQLQNEEWIRCKRAFLANDYPKAVASCDEMVNNLSMARADLSFMLTDYEDFRNSEEFQAWYSEVDYP